MSTLHRSVSALALSAVAALPLAAQQTNSVIRDITRDIDGVHKQIAQLAGAFPADKWDWRPGQGVRSVGEVFQHLSADNYLIAAATGAAAPAETGIKATDYQTAVAFETRKMTRDEVIAHIEKSFAFLKKVLNELPAAKLAQPSAFGPESTNQGAILLAATHVHEHLGQLIAYARVNNIVPPWSR